MLICDEASLSDQPLLSGHLPAPRGWPPNGASTVCVFLDLQVCWKRQKMKSEGKSRYVSAYLNVKEMRKKQSVISQILLPVRAGLEISASGLNLCELSRLERFSERVIQCIQTNKYYYCNLFTYLSVGNGLLQKPVAVCLWNISMCIECTVLYTIFGCFSH